MSCKKDENTPEEKDHFLPATRCFYMGMVPWPYDYTEEAVEYTYDVIENHADLIAHQIDNGIPWDKALNGESYHDNVEKEIDFRVGKLISGQKVYLVINAIGSILENRSGIAGYWDESNNMELPAGWKDKELDDPDVIKAYINHVLYMVQRFDPDYVAYGIEVNMLAKNAPEKFDKYLVLIEKVYKQVKNKHADLDLFLTIELETYVEDPVNQKAAVQRLIPYTDYVAVSSYPYNYKEDPASLPDNWFSQLHELAPDKPFAIAETSFLAENLTSDQYNINIKGNENWQSQYVEFLFEKASELNAEFIVWFIPRDYNDGWITMQQLGANEIAGAWRDTGLYDENGNPRRSLNIWDAWFKLPID